MFSSRRDRQADTSGRVGLAESVTPALSVVAIEGDVSRRRSRERGETTTVGFLTPQTCSIGRWSPIEREFPYPSSDKQYDMLIQGLLSARPSAIVVHPGVSLSGSFV